MYANAKGVKLHIFCWPQSRSLFSEHFSKAEMELKRKQEEVDRKKREEEEKVMQVWTSLNVIFLHLLLYCPAVKL